MKLSSIRGMAGGMASGLLLALGALTAACGGGGSSSIDAGVGPDAPLVDGGGGDVPDAPPGGGDDAMGADAAPNQATIIINEVVTHARQDWGDSGGDGEPFDRTPGDGRISSSDQYIELYNAGTTIVDIRNWELTMVDASSDTALISESNTEIDLAISPGSTLSALQPGGFVVVGNPDGTMANDVFITLRDASGRLVDDVEIGGVGRDAEGDGPEDGAPSPSENGFARGVFEEAIARPVGAGDTNVDALDFVKMPATPLAPNIAPEPPDETVPPDVVTEPTGNSFPVTQLIRIGFSEAIDADSIDGNVAISAGGLNIPVVMFTLDDLDKVLVLNTVGRLPFDQDIQVTVTGGAGGLSDRAGNALASNLQATFHTEPAPANANAVMLNELCISAQQDWNHSSGGQPFSATPGIGDVSSSDEWVELLVNQAGLDLSGYTLEVFNGPTVTDPTLSITPLNEATINIFGSGTLTSTASGDRIIIGNPNDSMEESIFVALRDEFGQLVDAVEVGGNNEDEDRGGDGIENGAPEPGADGDSQDLSDEVVARVPDGVDTGDDVADWAHAVATPGAPNQ